MSEPTSLAVGIILFLGGLSATVDSHLLTGAFAGGTLFVLLSTEYAPLKRIFLMLASILIGYLVAPEIQHRLDLQSGVVPAVVISACAVVVVEAVRYLFKNYDFSNLLPNRGKRGH